AAALPRTGGVYEYLRRAYGRTVAFVFGWSMLLLLLPSSVGSFARLAAEATVTLAGWPPDATRESLLSVAILLGALAANLVGLRSSARLQTGIAITKYLGVASLGLLGLLAPIQGAPPAPPAAPPPAATAAGAFAALVSV